MNNMIEILSEEKKVTAEKVVIKYEDVRKFFPEEYSSRDMHRQIIRLLEKWQDE